MKFEFIGVPGESHETLTMYGVTFTIGVPAEMEDERYVTKLANHPHFRAVAEAKPDDEAQATAEPAEPIKRGPGRPKKA